MALASLQALLHFVKQGSDSNWWGIWCPAHCQGPGVGSLLAAYLFGILTVVLGHWALREARKYLWVQERVVEPQVTRVMSAGARRRLAGYAHGQGALY